MVYVFKEKQGTYNPQKTEGKPYKQTPKGEAGVYGKHIRTDTENKTGDRYPTSILYIPEDQEAPEEREYEMVYVFKEGRGIFLWQLKELYLLSSLMGWRKTLLARL